LPAVEVGPREIRGVGDHRSLFNQPQQRHGSHGGAGRSRSMRS
jgi:hypothetical protein